LIEPQDVQVRTRTGFVSRFGTTAKWQRRQGAIGIDLKAATRTCARC
jgi:hypothetical protein